MPTIDMLGDNEQRATEPMTRAAVTVHEVHHRVCNARTRHGVHGPAQLPHHGRRRKHLPVSQYRAHAGSAVTPGSADTAATDVVGQRQLVLTVLVSAAAVGLLYLLAIRVLEPGINSRPVLLGALLIATAAAVVLNAISIDATRRIGRNRRH